MIDCDSSEQFDGFFDEIFSRCGHKRFRRGPHGRIDIQPVVANRAGEFFKCVKGRI